MNTFIFRYYGQYLTCIAACLFSLAAYAEEIKVDAPRTFFEGDSIDYTRSPEPEAEKGAALLVWQKSLEATSAEIVISPSESPNKKTSFSATSNFFHIMVFFDKEYSWMVRYLDDSGNPLSDFSEAKTFRILRKTEKKVVETPVEEPQGPRPFGKKKDPEKVVFELPLPSENDVNDRKPASTSIKEFVEEAPEPDDDSDYSY